MNTNREWTPQNSAQHMGMDFMENIKSRMDRKLQGTADVSRTEGTPGTPLFTESVARQKAVVNTAKPASGGSMKTQTYTGSNYKAILYQIKQEHGDSAVIVSSEKVDHPAGHEFGFNYEVIVGETKETVKRTNSVFPSTPPAPSVRQPQPTRTDDIQVATDKFSGLSGNARTGRAPVAYPAPPEDMPLLSEMVDSMRDSEVRENVINQMISEIQEKAETRDFKSRRKLTALAMGQIARHIKAAGLPAVKQDQPLKLAVIGPTGAGKTLSLIKLATNREFYGGRRIGIISFDTGKIAALEQMKIFAQIAKVDMRPVYKPRDVINALNEFSDKEVILIDTPGKPHRNSKDLQKLNRLLQPVDPDEIHLVLPMTTKYSDLKEMAVAYRQLNYNRIMLSKVDETGSFGSVLNLAAELNPVFGFISFGQTIPVDIMTARPLKLASWILNAGSFEKERIA